MCIRDSYNQTCNNNIMREISLELERVNPFVRSFIALKDHCQRVENQNKEICMLIKVNRGLDLCRYNDAVQDVYKRQGFHLGGHITSK